MQIGDERGVDYSFEVIESYNNTQHAEVVAGKALLTRWAAATGLREPLSTDSVHSLRMFSYNAPQLFEDELDPSGRSAGVRGGNFARPQKSGGAGACRPKGVDVGRRLDSSRRFKK